MKRFALITLMALMVLSLALTACTPKPTEVVDTGYPAPETNAVIPAGYPAPGLKVVVVTDATFPPFETVDEATKDLTGFDIELMNAIAAKLGLEVEYVNTGFDPALAGVASCQYDAAIAAITITDARKAEMLFSEPYINAGQVVVVAKDNTTINSKDDLDGLTVAAQLGTTGEIEAQAIPNVTYKPYDTYDLALLDLANGQVDAVIADYPTALGFIGQNPDDLKTVGPVFTNESYGIAVCNSKPELVGYFNLALAALKADGTINNLEQKWLAGQ